MFKWKFNIHSYTLKWPLGSTGIILHTYFKPKILYNNMWLICAWYIFS